MAAEPTQHVGQRRVRTPSPNSRPNRPGGGLVATEWQDQIDGLQQQIGTLSRNLANQAHGLAKLGVAIQSGEIPSITSKIDSLATLTDNRFISGGDKVQLQLNKLHEKVQAQLDNLQMELRALTNGRRSMPQSPEPPSGVSIPTYHNLSPNVNQFDNQFEHHLISEPNAPTVPSGDVTDFENPFAMGNGVQANDGQATGPPQPCPTTYRPPPQQTPHTQQPNDFGFNHHPYYGAAHPHNVQFAPCRL